MPQLEAGQTIVTVTLASHGYQWVGRFVVNADGNTTLTQSGDLQPESTQQLAERLDLGPALNWLRLNKYSPASRSDVGRVAQMTIVSQDVRYCFWFHRSRTLLNPNPVDAIIDQLAEYGPILLDY